MNKSLVGANKDILFENGTLVVVHNPNSIGNFHTKYHTKKVAISDLPYHIFVVVETHLYVEGDLFTGSQESFLCYYRCLLHPVVSWNVMHNLSYSFPQTDLILYSSLDAIDFYNKFAKRVLKRS